MIPDVVVYGAGPAGCLAALAVRKQGATVAIIEGCDARGADFAETVAPEFDRALHEIGLGERWRTWTAKRPVATFSSTWKSAASERIVAGFHPYGLHHLVMRSDMTTLLRKWIKEEGIPVTPTTTSANNSLLIDATGRVASIARRRGGVRCKVTQLIALLGTAEFRCRDASVFVEADVDGWFFAAPGLSNRASIGFYTDRVEHGGHSLQANKLLLAFERSQNIRRNIEANSIRFDATVLASSSYVEPATGAGWLAVGDAAFASDPLSSSGLTFAAESAIASARAAASGDRATYEHFVARRVARFRIERQKVYAAAAHRFRTPFWVAQAALTPVPFRGGRLPPVHALDRQRNASLA